MAPQKTGVCKTALLVRFSFWTALNKHGWSGSPPKKMCIRLQVSVHGLGSLHILGLEFCLELDSQLTTAGFVSLTFCDMGVGKLHAQVPNPKLY